MRIGIPTEDRVGERLVAATPTTVARLVGLPIFDPHGDQVGKVRDLVVAIRSETSQPRVLGLVAEVFGRRRIFVPMTRVTCRPACSSIMLSSCL